MSGAGASPDVDQPDPPPRSRVAFYYAGLILVTAAVVVIVLVAGHGKHGQPSVAPSSACLGSKFTLDGSGSRYTLSSANKKRGTLSYQSAIGVLSGTIACNHGGSRQFRGTAINLTIDTMLIAPAGATATSEH